MQTIIAAILVFGLLILAHELGHYFIARLTGIRVLELAIGFGPKLFGWTRQGIDYSLRVFPLGGFCRMMGESPDEAKEPDSFPQKPLLSRMAVLLAGSTMNLVLAIVVFFVIFFFIVGVIDDSAQVEYIVEDSPAEEAGIEVGDEIAAIDGKPIDTWEEVLSTIHVKPDQELQLEIKRNDSVLEFTVEAEREPETDRGLIGIGKVPQRYNFIPALQTSFEQFGLIFAAFYYTVSGQVPVDVAGPVGIVSIIGEAAQIGFVNVLMLTGLLSVNLGVINLLPIPALDGGRLLFLFIEAIRGRPIEPEKEGFIHFLGFALLIALILFITYQDVLRFLISPGE